MKQIKNKNMIGYINGLIIDKEEKTLLVLAQNIGYNIFATTELISTVSVDQKIQLFIHTAVREDDISLYGFSKKEELTFYKQLISVSGIGPKMALDILSTPIHLTQQAILSEDSVLLTNIKGLGKKTAERIILELKNKITSVAQSAGKAVSATYNEEVITALTGLGYEKFEVIKALAEMPPDINKTEDVIKHFLRQG